ncbi:C45 family autoproteolytic acyltransferase/hydolase, partial [Cloacibacillus porcorum]
CSGIAVWGDYAEGPLVYGRNYDYLPWFKEFDEDIVLACFHPGDGSLAVATLGYAGEIYAVNGMNEKGIFLELNNGMPSGGALWYDSRVPAVTELFSFLLDCSTLDEIESCFQTTKANFAYIVGVADGQTARCFEWPVFEVKRRESHSRPGLTVLTNHFTEFSWGLPRPDDKTYWMTRTRRQNLLTLAKHFKGTINEKVMMDIMDSKIEELGATTDLTLYQMVVVPERYELWFKIPGAQEWTPIDMKEILKPREG